MARTFISLAAICALIGLTGCGGGGGIGRSGGSASNDSDSEPPVGPSSLTTSKIVGIRVWGTTDRDTTATVAGVADQDASPTSYSVEFACDGGSGETSLPDDLGASTPSQDWHVPIVISDADGSRTIDLICTINP